MPHHCMTIFNHLDFFVSHMQMMKQKKKHQRTTDTSDTIWSNVGRTDVLVRPKVIKKSSCHCFAVQAVISSFSLLNILDSENVVEHVSSSILLISVLWHPVNDSDTEKLHHVSVQQMWQPSSFLPADHWLQLPEDQVSLQSQSKQLPSITPRPFTLSPLFNNVLSNIQRSFSFIMTSRMRSSAGLSVDWSVGSAMTSTSVRDRF